MNHLDDRIILKWIFRQWDGGAWTGLVWFRTDMDWTGLVQDRHGLDWSSSGQVQLRSACEYGNEPSGSIKCGEFLD
jgi:hypothetical protein